MTIVGWSPLTSVLSNLNPASPVPRHNLEFIARALVYTAQNLNAEQSNVRQLLHSLLSFRLQHASLMANTIHTHHHDFVHRWSERATNSSLALLTTAIDKIQKCADENFRTEALLFILLLSLVTFSRDDVQTWEILQHKVIVAILQECFGSYTRTTCTQLNEQSILAIRAIVEIVHGSTLGSIWPTFQSFFTQQLKFIQSDALFRIFEIIIIGMEASISSQQHFKTIESSELVQCMDTVIGECFGVASWTNIYDPKVFLSCQHSTAILHILLLFLRGSKDLSLVIGDKLYIYINGLIRSRFCEKAPPTTTPLSSPAIWTPCLLEVFARIVVVQVKVTKEHDWFYFLSEYSPTATWIMYGRTNEHRDLIVHLFRYWLELDDSFGGRFSHLLLVILLQRALDVRYFENSSWRVDLPIYLEQMYHQQEIPNTMEIFKWALEKLFLVPSFKKFIPVIFNPVYVARVMDEKLCRKVESGGELDKTNSWSFANYTTHLLQCISHAIDSNQSISCSVDPIKSILFKVINTVGLIKCNMEMLRVVVNLLEMVIEIPGLAMQWDRLFQLLIAQIHTFGQVVLEPIGIKSLLRMLEANITFSQDPKAQRVLLYSCQVNLAKPDRCAVLLAKLVSTIEACNWIGLDSHERFCANLVIILLNSPYGQLVIKSSWLVDILWACAAASGAQIHLSGTIFKRMQIPAPCKFIANDEPNDWSTGLASYTNQQRFEQLYFNNTTFDDRDGNNVLLAYLLAKLAQQESNSPIVATFLDCIFGAIKNPSLRDRFKELCMQFGLYSLCCFEQDMYYNG